MLFIPSVSPSARKVQHCLLLVRLRGNGSQLLVLPHLVHGRMLLGPVSMAVGARYISGVPGHSCVLEKQTLVPGVRGLADSQP